MISAQMCQPPFFPDVVKISGSAQCQRKVHRKLSFYQNGVGHDWSHIDGHKRCSMTAEAKESSKLSRPKRKLVQELLVICKSVVGLKNMHIIIQSKKREYISPILRA